MHDANDGPQLVVRVVSRPFASTDRGEAQQRRRAGHIISFVVDRPGHNGYALAHAERRPPRDLCRFWSVADAESVLDALPEGDRDAFGPTRLGYEIMTLADAFGEMGTPPPTAAE